MCNFTTSPICYGSHCCDAYHNFYCRNFKSNRRIWTSPVREIELSIALEKRVEMTSIMNLILDPAKLSRPCRVESSGHLFHTFDWLANACHVRFIVRFNPFEEQKASYSFPLLSQFWVKIFDITGHQEQTVIPSNDHAPIISNQKFFINFKKCVVIYAARFSILQKWLEMPVIMLVMARNQMKGERWKIGMKNYEISNFKLICAHSIYRIRYTFFYYDYWKSTILYGPNCMPNIYIAYNKVTYSNAWFLWKSFK